KGIGRTALAANWTFADDAIHATGHLAASSATREVVVSRYFAAKGKKELINACEGALAAPLAPELADPSEWAVKAAEHALPADAAIQTITVKGGRFLRFTNLSWYLANLGGPGDVGRFFRLIADGLVPDLEIKDGSLTPAWLAGELARAIER